MADEETPRKKSEKMKPGRIGPWLVAIGIFALFLFIIERTQSGGGGLEMNPPELERQLASDNVAEVVLEDGTFVARVALVQPSDATYVVKLGGESGLRGLAEKLDQEYPGVDYRFENASPLAGMARYLIPLILFMVILYFLFIRQLRSAGGIGGNVLAFGKSRARLITKDREGVTFDDVAGVDEAKEELREVIEFLKHPQKFQRLGGRVPRGILLVGSPGTGKTLLARAIAGEAKVPFFSICGSDFVEMFVGVGASRVRDLFKQAKDSSPCIIFLDEVDAVGRRRGSGLGGGHDEREQTLNAILVEMDGFESDEGVIVLAATNRPDVLDPALLRPGRFDRQISVDLPDLPGRAEIIRVHSRNVKLAADVDMETLARGTPGFSGAELEAMVNEAAILAAMRDRDDVAMEELEEARDKVRWGRQKRSRVMEEADRRVTAFHEGGHALVAHLLPEVEPLHKVTIIPRGMALGATMQLPEKDRYHLQRKTVLGNIVVLYAGRIAEKLACDDISSGAQNDIEKATELAHAMVCEWGMSDELGPISYGENEETVFLGREITRSRNHSEATAEAIDGVVKKILGECYERSEALIVENRESLDIIAGALLEYETLSGQEVDRLLKGESIETIKRTAPTRGGARAVKPAVEPGAATEEEKGLDEGLAGARGSEAVG